MLEGCSNANGSLGFAKRTRSARNDDLIDCWLRLGYLFQVMEMWGQDRARSEFDANTAS